jgi:AraC-like DNA-binding protein
VAPGASRDFELWRWAVSPMFDGDAAVPDGRASFVMESQGYLYGEMPVSTQLFTPCRFDRTPRVIARAGLDDLLVQVYDKGDYLFRADGAEQVVRVGDILVLDLTRPSVIRTQAASTLAMNVPRHLLAPLVSTLDTVHGHVIKAGTPINALLVAHMRELLVQGPRIDIAAGVAMSGATAGLVAACTGTSADGRDQAATSVRGAALHLIRQAIDKQLADPALGPDLLMQQFHLSRARLYRLFEPLGGVMTYIQQRRLMRVHRAISNPALLQSSIMLLAERYGFTEKTAFSRAYRAFYGVSPSEVRAEVRRGFRAASDRQPTATDSFLVVNRLLHGLQTEKLD